MSRRILIGALITATWLGFASARAAVAEPSTTPKYPSSSSATAYAGLAFDQCSAPSLPAMQAWAASPYRAIGVYIGGVNRSCSQAQLTPSWVASVAAAGWSLMPIYVGPQPACRTNPGTQVIIPASAASQGTAAATDAVAQAKALGMLPGSAIYNDLENYFTTDTACRAAVLTYLSAWTRQLHALGFISGIYVNLSSGAKDLAGQYTSATLARPDAIWMARYDGVTSLRDWSGVPNTYWTQHQRAKQFAGNVTEVYGGVPITIDRNQWDAPVATLSFRHLISASAPVAARSGPSSSSRAVATYAPGSVVKIACQTAGTTVSASKVFSKVWNKLTNGTYVPDVYVDTGSAISYTAPISKCAYPYQVTADVTARTGPGTKNASKGSLPSGSLAWVTCQRLGTAVKGTKVWDKLNDGRWVADHYVATPSKTTFSGPIPRC